MAFQTFPLRNEYIALCDLLKTLGIAPSGGVGKMMVAEGLVEVDGVLESRKTAKIRPGMIVKVLGEEIHVIAEDSAE